MKQILEYYAVGLAHPDPATSKPKKSSPSPSPTATSNTAGPTSPSAPMTVSRSTSAFHPLNPPPSLPSSTSAPPPLRLAPHAPPPPPQRPHAGSRHRCPPRRRPAAQPACTHLPLSPAASARGPQSPEQAARGPRLPGTKARDGFAFVTFNDTDSSPKTPPSASPTLSPSALSASSPRIPITTGASVRRLGLRAHPASSISSSHRPCHRQGPNSSPSPASWRGGKSSLVAGAFDDRIALVRTRRQLPVPAPPPSDSPASTHPGGNEGLTEMVRKYPNWFAPHLHDFGHQPE